MLRSSQRIYTVLFADEIRRRFFKESVGSFLVVVRNPGNGLRQALQIEHGADVGFKGAVDHFFAEGESQRRTLRDFRG